MLCVPPASFATTLDPHCLACTLINTLINITRPARSSNSVCTAFIPRPRHKAYPNPPRPYLVPLLYYLLSLPHPPFCQTPWTVLFCPPMLTFPTSYILLAPKDKDHYSPILDLERTLYTIVERE
jgi:hypothetical protein